MAVIGAPDVEVAVADVGTDIDDQPLAVGALDDCGLRAALGSEAERDDRLVASRQRRRPSRARRGTATCQERAGCHQGR
ncbi:hypothetical protein D3C72_459830 [compost metagenome]